MNDLIIIAGPTAVGKSDLAIKLAKKIKGSIISADSMQVYRKMDIGTAKLTGRQMQDIPHYLIDILDPAEDFNIVSFKERATAAIKEIYAFGRIPMIVGGTGFYIQSVLYDIDFGESDELTEYRKKLQNLIDEKGSMYVHDMLRATDPESALRIHHNDHKRMIRALEYNMQTGGLISDHNADNAKRTSPYNYCYFVLNDDRKAIYDRINRRVDDMMKNGLVDEVKMLKERGLTKDNVSMHGIGYKEIMDYLDGNVSLEEAVNEIKLATRHFAKRQLTWYKRENDVIWLNMNEDKDIFKTIEEELLKKGIGNG